jgi:hypothetical protein
MLKTPHQVKFKVLDLFIFKSEKMEDKVDKELKLYTAIFVTLLILGFILGMMSGNTAGPFWCK